MINFHFLLGMLYITPVKCVSVFAIRVIIVFCTVTTYDADRYLGNVRVNARRMALRVIRTFTALR